MNKDIVIISGGRLGNPDFFRKSLKEIDNRLLICCDGGARHLGASGFLPDVIVGDMDSIDPLQKAHYEHQGVEMIRHPANKDFTDTALALEYALSMKPRSIQIWGALGGRMDHAMANVYLLIRGKRSGVKTCLLDEFCKYLLPQLMFDLKMQSGALFRFWH